VTVILPPGRIPKVASEVPVDNGTVPVPIAGAPFEAVAAADELEAVDEEDAVELDDDEDVELPKRDCTAEDSWELTRLSAIPLAMLALPLDRSVIAAPITLISEFCADEACDWACAWFQ
jgi:hypothetical protein